MYSIKQAQLVMGSLPLADITIYYIDIRAFGKGYEEFYEQAKGMGVYFVKGRVAQIGELDNGNLDVQYETIDGDGGLGHQEHDLVVLSTGFRVPPDLVELGRKLGIELNEHHFAAGPNVLRQNDLLNGRLPLPGHEPGLKGQYALVATDQRRCRGVGHGQHGRFDALGGVQPPAGGVTGGHGMHPRHAGQGGQGLGRDGLGDAQMIGPIFNAPLAAMPRVFQRDRMSSTKRAAVRSREYSVFQTSSTA